MKSSRTMSHKESRPMDDVMEVESKADACASLTYPEAAYKLRCGDYAMLNDHACRVVSIKRGKTSKHGHAKMRVTGTDMFTNKKVMAVLPVSHKVYKPVVHTQELMFLDYDEHDEVAPLSLMDAETGEVRNDVHIDDSEAAAKLMQHVRKMQAVSGEVRDRSASDASEDSAAEHQDLMVTIIEAMGRACIKSIKLCK